MQEPLVVKLASMLVPPPIGSRGSAVASFNRAQLSRAAPNEEAAVESWARARR